MSLPCTVNDQKKKLPTLGGFFDGKKLSKIPFPPIIFPKRLQFQGFCDILFLIKDHTRMENIYGYDYSLPLH
jgi:hypothetical protein